MTLTLVELCDKLKEIEETILLEKLNITSEDLVVKFEDLIEESFDKFSEEYEDEYDE